jgi:GGDEF domain-containing protein
LILPDTGSEGAAAVGERVRERVNGPPVPRRGRARHSSHRVRGSGDAPGRGGIDRRLIQAATRMYYVKEHGKNGIYIAGSGSEERI